MTAASDRRAMLEALADARLAALRFQRLAAEAGDKSGEKEWGGRGKTLKAKIDALRKLSLEEWSEGAAVAGAGLGKAQERVRIVLKKLEKQTSAARAVSGALSALDDLVALAAKVLK